MTVNQLQEKLSLKKLSNSEDCDVVSCYISDLLSRVLGGCETGDIWITVQTSINMIAVAMMVGASCVIFPEGLTAPDNVIEKANEEGLAVFTSDETAYELAIKIAKLV